MASTLDIQYARSQFPSLESGYIFADNAGGSQALLSVADAVRDYLLNSNVQLGATYPASQRATKRVEHGDEAAGIVFNAESRDEIAFGSSTTQLLANLAKAISMRLDDDAEIVITGEHEANAGPWKYIASARSPALKLNVWVPTSANPKNPYAVSYNGAIPDLLKLITANTRVLAISGCSNLVGEILDFEKVVKAVREKKAQVGGESLWIVVDLVAYAPHRSIDVKKWDVDFAVFSWYKVYGPHTAAMYTRSSELEKIGSVAHHFHSPKYDGLPFKLQPGGAGYELTYATSAVLPYLYRLSQTTGNLINSEELLATKSKAELRKALEHTSSLFEAHEGQLAKLLLEFLTSSKMYERGVRVVGPETLELRAPTISFIVIDTPRAKGIRSQDIITKVDAKGTMGFRWGHFYAYGLVSGLPNFQKVPKEGERSIDDGIVRISLVHYNTVAEVEKIIAALEEILSAN
ncbi:hypothetical protein M422DRAFT_275687 [Sphaerobolus stellatus SS14]|uniref:Aminotransferase class V domain-containing protein n=1 Tax=Sphaerobolus stellatus (strain SS14) TaxID=990650 RepID=A0A0C9UEL9_SPHS4|nr:hypothetical protein M422DRAFT_275687 [Sphaerobolus stellatus SS14]